MNSFEDTPTNNPVDAESTEGNPCMDASMETEHAALSANLSPEPILNSESLAATDAPVTEDDGAVDDNVGAPSASPHQQSASPEQQPPEPDQPVAAEPDVAHSDAPLLSDAAVAQADVLSGDEAEAASAPPVDAAYVDNPTMNWFIIHTYSGFENKVAESLRSRSEAFGFDHRLGQILIPTEEVVEMRNGKKISSKRLLYPGYVLVQMEMDDDLWHQVKNTPRVTGFIGGGGGKPVPLSATEVNSILFRQSTAAERPRPKLSFDKNETVRIVDGPFANFSGKVDEINPERNTLRVMVTIFGRSTPVELDFLQVEKIA